MPLKDQGRDHRVPPGRFHHEGTRLLPVGHQDVRVLCEPGQHHHRERATAGAGPKKIEQLMFLHAVSEKTSATLDLNKLVDIITSTAFRLTRKAAAARCS